MVIKGTLGILFLSAAVLTASGPAIINQWESIGPPGSSITSVGVGPDGAVYGGAANPSRGLFRRGISSSSWNVIRPTEVELLTVDPGSPGTIYYSRPGWVEKSTDGGQTWMSSPEFFQGLPLDCGRNAQFVIDPSASNVVYALRHPCGVFKSMDGGISFSKTSIGLFAEDAIVLTIAPSTPHQLYAGGLGGKVFRGDNGGASWSLAGVVPNSDRPVTALAVDPDVPTTLYAGAGTYGGSSLTHLFKSFDAGSTWQPINAGFPAFETNVPFLAIDPGDPTTLYAAASGSSYDPDFPGSLAGLYKSTNAGGSWTRVFHLGVPSSIAIDPTNPSVLYLGLYQQVRPSEAGIYRSLDGGATWERFHDGISSHIIDVVEIDPSASETIYAGSRFQGLFRSNNGGGTWSSIRAGRHGFPRALAVSPNAFRKLMIS